MTYLTRRQATASFIIATAAALSACTSSTDTATDATDKTSSSSQPTSTEAPWPRTITHDNGETLIEAQPKRIVSTSVTLTGTLLAINAPVVASAATNVSPLTDDRGFFTQWAQVATERHVDVCYSNLEFNLEAVVAANPDLVVVASSGQDSAADHYDQLAELFPTIVLDYASHTWEELAEQLALATGLEEEASQAKATYDKAINEARESITPPEGAVSIVSFNDPSKNQAVAKPTGPHGELLSALGLEVAAAPEGLDDSGRNRGDFDFVSFENLSQAITGQSVFLIKSDDKGVEKFLATDTLANLPAVVNHQVYPLGLDSFRIDFYSGQNIAKAVVSALGK